MRRLLFAVLAILLISGVAFADGIPTGVDAENFPARWTRTVYNNYTTALTSGTVVIWDADGATGDYEDLLPYVTTTTTEDHIKVAGVVISDSIAIGGSGEICVYGPAITRIADATEAVTEDELVGTAAARGRAGAYTTGTDTGYLGYIIHDTAPNVDSALMKVFVNPGMEG